MATVPLDIFISHTRKLKINFAIVAIFASIFMTDLRPGTVSAETLICVYLSQWKSYPFCLLTFLLTKENHILFIFCHQIGFVSS